MWYVLEEAINKGKEQGRILEAMEMAEMYGLDKENVKKYLQKTLNLTPEEIEEHLQTVTS